MDRTTQIDPTASTYDGLTVAYNYFNQALFGDELPPCLITLQRHKGAYGYFSGGRFSDREGKATDEIALNPAHILGRSVEASLSTLVHEMVHLRQHHFGKPSRTGYHNKQWAAWMREVGLIASTTGMPGGKEVGAKVSHYIEKGGRFAVACATLIDQGLTLNYGERCGDEEKRAKKAASKTKYTCATCGANAWAKPDLRLICGDCDEQMWAEVKDDGEDC